MSSDVDTTTDTHPPISYDDYDQLYNISCAVLALVASRQNCHP